MEIDSKTVAIFILGALLLFLVLGSSSGTGAASGAAVQQVSGLPGIVGGC